MSTGSGKKEKRNVNNLPLMRKVVASVAVDHVVLPTSVQAARLHSLDIPSRVLHILHIELYHCQHPAVHTWPSLHQTLAFPHARKHPQKKKRSIQSHPCRHAFCLGLPWPRCPSFVPVVSTSTFHLTVTCDRPTM